MTRLILIQDKTKILHFSIFSLIYMQGFQISSSLQPSERTSCFLFSLSQTCFVNIEYRVYFPIIHSFGIRGFLCMRFFFDSKAISLNATKDEVNFCPFQSFFCNSSEPKLRRIQSNVIFILSIKCTTASQDLVVDLSLCCLVSEF